jgi:hypothetical protein
MGSRARGEGLQGAGLLVATASLDEPVNPLPFARVGGASYVV